MATVPKHIFAGVSITISAEKFFTAPVMPQEARQEGEQGKKKAFRLSMPIHTEDADSFPS